MAAMKRTNTRIMCLAALAVMATLLISSAEQQTCSPYPNCFSNEGGLACSRLCAVLIGPSGKATCQGHKNVPADNKCCCAPPAGGRKERLRTSAPLRTSDVAPAGATNEAAS
ncbi:hypothetical protein CFC21_100499 [Triticum aestivum]|uniref:Uncharacterized protein n=2 Tax=Triticum aestivum TaxID=4565 RepID=A0A9R1N303_WHEAT|nr:hypothetical protein CFC21_100499 [Triticum aestivum]